MGMIAFYAGLFIGILLGLFAASLLTITLGRDKDQALSDSAPGYSQADPLEP